MAHEAGGPSSNPQVDAYLQLFKKISAYETAKQDYEDDEVFLDALDVAWSKLTSGEREMARARLADTGLVGVEAGSPPASMEMRNPSQNSWIVQTWRIPGGSPSVVIYTHEANLRAISSFTDIRFFDVWKLATATSYAGTTALTQAIARVDRIGWPGAESNCIITKTNGTYLDVSECLV